MSPTVSCQACPDYDQIRIQAAVQACFEDLGGLEVFVRPGDTVFLKPNLLMPAKPDQAITTHPAIVRAVIHAVKAVGGEPVLGDSPAATPLELTARRAGVLQVCRQEGVPLADMRTGIEVGSERVQGRRRFEVARAALRADVVINLPKLKTHALTRVTLAQKNLFGLVPGLQKGRWHMNAQAPDAFAGLLADLYASIIDQPDGPRHFLHLMDGVLAMEGNGPGTGGTPRAAGVILASTDAVAIDRVACEIVGLDPSEAPLLRISNERGLGEADLDRIELAGVPLEALTGRPFEPAPGMRSSPSLQAALWSSRYLRNLALDRPLVRREPCVACGHCKRICPADAVRVEAALGAARMDYDRCIRCYCCAEICPEAAIDKSPVPLPGRLMVHPAAHRVGLATLAAGLVLVAGGLTLLFWSS